MRKINIKARSGFIRKNLDNIADPISDKNIDAMIWEKAHRVDNYAWLQEDGIIRSTFSDIGHQTSASLIATRIGTGGLPKGITNE